MFPYVSFVFCAGFATLSRLICCFHVCCIWHFPFSLVAFHLSIFSTYHVASFQLALVTSMCSSFVKCAPFQVAFALSIFPPFAIFASFQLACCFPIFFCNCHVCPFQICIFQFHFVCIVSPFFQDVNILEQAQFDSTRLTKKLFLGFLPIYNKCFWQIVPTTCLGAWSSWSVKSIGQVMGPLTYGMSCIKHAENRSYATEVVFFRAGLYRISSRKKANEHKHTHMFWQDLPGSIIHQSTWNTHCLIYRYTLPVGPRF